jgi:NAD(P)H-quinone oxidoreductase subunit 5
VSQTYSLLETAIAVACAAPLLLLLVLAISAMSGKGLGERGIGLATRVALMTSLLASVVALFDYVVADREPLILSYGSWFSSTEGAFAFDLALDGYSLCFAAVALAICNVVAAFSFRYLHLESGFRRYFIQMAMFVVGIVFVALAGSIEVLFVGWELLGLSSALLVGFFHERRAPVANALRVFAVYRGSDAAMLAAAVLLHHWAGSGSLSQLFSVATGPQTTIGSGEALAIAILLIVAVAGKSALWPLSGWLPRAMEGPTPSSAVYYGALSIHAGCFLLLRAQPVVAESFIATGVVAFLGVATFLYGALTARVQTDVKSALSFAALAQVGIIVVEIAVGLRAVAFLHIVGHASFRLLQFLSAPNVLHDLHELENRLGGHLSPGGPPAAPRSTVRLLYFVALERGFVDSILDRLIVQPFRSLAAALDWFDRRLVGAPRRSSPETGEPT